MSPPQTRTELPTRCLFGRLAREHNRQPSCFFDRETYDTAHLHSTTANTSRLTAPVTGVYRVEAEVDWTPTSTALTDVRIELAVDRTLGSAAPSDEEAKDLSNGNHLRAAAEFKLTAGSYVEVVATHGGAAEQVFARRFTMSWIAPG